MSGKNSNQVSAVWQMSLRSDPKGEVLEIYNPMTDNHSVFIVKSVSHKPPNTQQDLLNRWVAAFQKKLKQAKIEIPNSCERLSVLIKQRRGL
jgi:hypothetical protein